MEVGRDVGGLVRRSGMERRPIVGRNDRDRRDPERAARSKHAQRDLATVRYEELLDRHSSANVSRQTADTSRYGTVSLVRCASAPPPDAPTACPGAQAPPNAAACRRPGAMPPRTGRNKAPTIAAAIPEPIVWPRRSAGVSVT